MSVGGPEASFSDRVAGVWGGLHELVGTTDDPDETAATFFQVTPAQLRAWRAAEGRHRCHGLTARGSACRNYASTAVDYDPRAWLARGPTFCPAHVRPVDTPPRPCGIHPPAATLRPEDDGDGIAR